MGFPKNSEHCITQTIAANVLSFDLVAPHGARVAATQNGCRIEFVAEHREHIYAWLKAELQRLETFGSKLEELETCPDCHSKMQIVNNLPVFCTTCKGMGKVTKSTAAAFITARQTEISFPTPTEIRPPSFQDEPHLTMTEDGFSVAPTKVVVGKVQPDTGEDDFIPPRPGEEGFIGPIQQY
jgi:hypothetical protein